MEYDLRQHRDYFLSDLESSVVQVAKALSYADQSYMNDFMNIDPGYKYQGFFDSQVRRLVSKLLGVKVAQRDLLYPSPFDRLTTAVKWSAYQDQKRFNTLLSLLDTPQNGLIRRSSGAFVLFVKAIRAFMVGDDYINTEALELYFGIDFYKGAAEYCKARDIPHEENCRIFKRYTRSEMVSTLKPKEKVLKRLYDIYDSDIYEKPNYFVCYHGSHGVVHYRDNDKEPFKPLPYRLFVEGNPLEEFMQREEKKLLQLHSRLR